MRPQTFKLITRAADFIEFQSDDDIRLVGFPQMPWKWDLYLQGKCFYASTDDIGKDMTAGEAVIWANKLLVKV